MNREDYLMLSGIQHFCFCKRQWALIHIEQVWAENVLTYGGNKFHEKSHNPYIEEARGHYFISRNLPVYSDKLRIYGVSDVVEFLKNDEGIRIKEKKDLYIPYAVEYKYGKEKQSDIDIMQLVAQTMCLEEMFSIKINLGYIYYGRTRRRLEVDVTEELKNKVYKTVNEMYEYFEREEIPVVEYQKHCRSCSLFDICNPKIKSKENCVDMYMDKYV